MHSIIYLGWLMSEYLNTLHHIFIEEDRYMFIVNGFFVTLEITFFAAIMGIILGMILSLMTISNFYPFKHSKIARLRKFNPLSTVAFTYINLIRGTPTVVQLFFLVYIVFTGSLAKTSTIVIASIAFGMNSAAYVAEIIRAGIQGLDKGQMAAARALGMSYFLSMRLIILPQAVKNIMPALVSEFIVLLKETAIVGIIGVVDLAYGVKIIQSTTFRAAEPLIVVALVYLMLTTIFTFFMYKIERRLRARD